MTGSPRRLSLDSSILSSTTACGLARVGEVLPALPFTPSCFDGVAMVSLVPSNDVKRLL